MTYEERIRSYEAAKEAEFNDMMKAKEYHDEGIRPSMAARKVSKSVDEIKRLYALSKVDYIS